MNESKFIIKYLFDKIIAIFFLFLSLPLFAIILLEIFIDEIAHFKKPESGIYAEKRVTQGRVFDIYKLRVFKPGLLEEVRKLGSVWFIQDNPENISNTGKLLIKFYLDELPQLFNIIRGQMSLVGPRPRIVPIYEEEFKRGYTALKYLRAGLTGPHQLLKGQGKRITEPYKSEEYFFDCQKKSALGIVIYDLKILLKTFLVIFKGKGL